MLGFASVFTGFTPRAPKLIWVVRGPRATLQMGPISGFFHQKNPHGIDSQNYTHNSFPFSSVSFWFWERQIQRPLFSRNARCSRTLLKVRTVSDQAIVVVQFLMHFSRMRDFSCLPYLLGLAWLTLAAASFFFFAFICWTLQICWGGGLVSRTSGRRIYLDQGAVWTLRGYFPGGGGWWLFSVNIDLLQYAWCVCMGPKWAWNVLSGPLGTGQHWGRGCWAMGEGGGWGQLYRALPRLVADEENDLGVSGPDLSVPWPEDSPNPMHMLLLSIQLPSNSPIRLKTF